MKLVIQSLCTITLTVGQIAIAFPVQSPKNLGVEPSSERPDVVTADWNDSEPLPLIKAVGNPEDDYRKMLEYIQYQREDQSSKVRPDVRGINVTPAEIQKWSQYFDTIIKINKAQDSQTAEVYRFGQLVKVIPVSTGKEKWVCEPAKDPNTGKNAAIGWDPTWTGTQTGYHRAKWCDIDHHSTAFDDSKMTYACFFNGGIATHTGMNPHLFGKSRDSHGCTRMSEEDAKQVYEWVTLSGGMPDSLDRPEFKGQCKPSVMKRPNGDPYKAQCIADAQKRTPRFQKDIQEMLLRGRENKDQNGSPMPLPYSSMPTVPEVAVNGTMNGTTAQGYRTLYIVQCVNKKGKDCSWEKDKIPGEPSEEDCDAIAAEEARLAGRPPPPPRARSAYQNRGGGQPQWTNPFGWFGR